MPEIKPFKGILYNQDKIKDLSKVVSGPYDVISQKARESYANLSPYNMVRLILPTANDAKDSGCDTIYSFARKELDDWLKKEILYLDRQEAIYLYEQEYVYCGEKKKRLGIITLLKIDDAGNSPKRDNKIHAHEHTHLGPKEDRLQLLREVGANLSPIFVLFADKFHLIRRISDKCNALPSLIDVEADSVRHKLWRITDSKLINEARRGLKSADIFIADGHHRYEVACNYRQEIRQRLNNPDREFDCDFVLTYLSDLNSRGLTIMPTHRVIKELDGDTLLKLNDELGKYFDIYKAKDKSELFIMLSKAMKSEYVLGMYAQGAPATKKENKFSLLRLKNRINLDKIIALDKPKDYKRLCVVILNHLILEKMLNIRQDWRDSDESSARHIFYTNDADLARRMVDDKEAQIAFFLNPVKVEEMAHIAKQGERMPPKSTFFYPKLLSGLLINKFNDIQ